MELLKNLSLAEVESLAFALAKKVNSRLVIGLSGDLGSGKTTFVKAFAKALGIKKIKSPSFIVIDTYSLGAKKFYHIDLYRLETAKQLKHLGLDHLLAESHIIAAIEWINKFPRLTKSCDVLIHFEVQDQLHRNVSVKLL